MDYLSLFSGAGGGDLAMQHLLGFRCRGYVENEPYCQEVIKARIEDGFLHAAPIFGDIREFNREYADCYQGMVDLITGGFPCQPFSVAGKQLGADDQRNMWPATLESLRLVRPRLAFLENVPGLLATGYFGRILGNLAESGFDARWKVVSAAEVGAPHKRDRLWIMSNLRIERRQQITESSPCNESEDEGWAISYALFVGTQISPPGGHSAIKMPECNGWWSVEPELGRVAHGVARRVDRLRAIGNGQVPIVAATAWDILSGGIR